MSTSCLYGTETFKQNSYLIFEYKEYLYVNLTFMWYNPLK